MDIIKNSGKTAISRSGKLSAPTRWALKNHIKRNHTIFDWGCGRGTDTEILHNLGYEVWGYDINHFTIELCNIDFDKINFILLNYVLNVVSEEIQNMLLTYIKSLYEGLILISVRKETDILYNANNNNWQEYKGGYITGKNTFQFGFSKQYLFELLNNYGDIIDFKSGSGYYCVINM